MEFCKNPIIAVAMMLALFAIVATSLVSLTEVSTRAKIKENQRQTLLTALNALVTSKQYDNDIVSDVLLMPANSELATKQPTTVYRARKDGKPVAAIFTSIAPDGYNGTIKLLVGIFYNGELAGVRVIEHKETPGLGDKIMLNKADWILQFAGLSLTEPQPSRWQVKKDGGEFDQFTGATITPRAVVAAVKRALIYFDQHRDSLFQPSASEEQPL